MLVYQDDGKPAKGVNKMSEYMWGGSAEYAPKIPDRKVTRRDRIARKIGGPACGFVQIHDPTGRWKSWFYGPNRGEPFDRQLAAEIDAACGVIR
jgi:hypothetical protein